MSYKLYYKLTTKINKNNAMNISNFIDFIEGWIQIPLASY